MSEMDLLERLAHFEKHQLEEGDEYGAEVLHHASTALRLLVEVGKAGKGLKEARDLVISAVTKQPTWVPTLVAHKKEWEKEFNKALAAAIADPDCAALISPKCAWCQGTGEVDSGAPDPQGNFILIPCQCRQLIGGDDE